MTVIQKVKWHKEALLEQKCLRKHMIRLRLQTSEDARASGGGGFVWGGVSPSSWWLICAEEKVKCTSLNIMPLTDSSASCSRGDPACSGRSFKSRPACVQTLTLNIQVKQKPRWLLCNQADSGVITGFKQHYPHYWHCYILYLLYKKPHFSSEDVCPWLTCSQTKTLQTNEIQRLNIH